MTNPKREEGERLTIGGFAEYLPVTAKRIAPGEYFIADKRDNALFRVDGAAFADWICMALNQASPAPAPTQPPPAKVEGEGLKAVEIRFNMTNAPDGSYYPAAQVQAAFGELHGKLYHKIEKAFSLAEAVGRQHKEIQSLSSQLAEARRKALEEAAKAAREHFDCDCQPAMVKEGLHHRDCDALYGEIISDVILALKEKPNAL